MGMPGGMPGMYGAPPMMAPKTSGMAITGFILAFFCSLLGLIFSIIGYNQVKNSNGALTGGGLAMAGIIISIVLMVLGILFSVASHGHAHF
jgi:Na+/melibiose symporter-like transporter